MWYNLTNGTFPSLAWNASIALLNLTAQANLVPRRDSINACRIRHDFYTLTSDYLDRDVKSGIQLKGPVEFITCPQAFDYPTCTNVNITAAAEDKCCEYTLCDYSRKQHSISYNNSIRYHRTDGTFKVLQYQGFSPDPSRANETYRPLEISLAGPNGPSLFHLRDLAFKWAYQPKENSIYADVRPLAEHNPKAYLINITVEQYKNTGGWNATIIPGSKYNYTASFGFWNFQFNNTDIEVNKIRENSPAERVAGLSLIDIHWPSRRSFLRPGDEVGSGNEDYRFVERILINAKASPAFGCGPGERCREVVPSQGGFQLASIELQQPCPAGLDFLPNEVQYIPNKRWIV